jgi:hypothetical protein
MLTPRQEIRWFADAMEMKLRENDHKGGWWSVVDGEIHTCDPMWLLERLRQEVDELAKEVAPEPCGCRALSECNHFAWGPDKRRVVKEAADIANFAMMIADVCGGLPLEVSEKVEETYAETRPATATAEETGTGGARPPHG